jgi:pimeloyl-ACP methyl ester carboxylesterase
LIEPLAEEIAIQTHHIRLTAKKWGTDGGLPVLGLHGWLDNANTFDRLAPLLPQLNLVSLDLPGHGKSGHRPAGMRYHYTDYLDDVMAAADKLGWERFTLLGHSMGAGIGCLAASAYPDRVARLILIEGLGAVTGELNDVPGLLRRSIESMKSSQLKKRAEYHSMEVLIRARAAAGSLTKDSAEIIVRRAVKRVGDDYGWRSDQRLKRPYPQYFTNEVMLAFLRGITSPVLLITAEGGTLLKRPYFQSRCKAIKNLRIVTLAGHHHLHLDNPAPVANAINGFIEKQRGPVK